MKYLRIAHWIVPCFVLALMPATLRLFGQGIVEENIVVDDCKPTGGKMGTDLTADANPKNHDFDDLPHEVKDESKRLHARYNVPATTVDATKSASAEPKLEFAPGSNLGNGGNAHKFATQDDWSKSPLENEGQAEITVSCLDCRSGEWNVDLFQSVTLEVSADWRPAQVPNPPGPPLGVQDQVPEWDLKVYFQGIGGRTGSLSLITSGLENGLASSYAESLGAPDTFTVSEFGEDPQDVEDQGYWAENWNPDAAYQIATKATWLLEENYEFSCRETGPGGPDVEEDLKVRLEWSLSIEDKADGFSYTEDVLNSVEANLQYATQIWISRIEVTRNCDDSADGCPCVKHPDPDSGD